MRPSNRFSAFRAMTLSCLVIIWLSCGERPQEPDLAVQTPVVSATSANGAEDCPVAEVGGATILYSDLERSCRDDENRVVPVPGMSREALIFRIRYERLDRLVVRETLRQEGLEMGIEISDERVDGWLREAGELGGAEFMGNLYPWLRGLSEARFREEVRTDLLVFEAARKKLGELTPVTEQEIRAFYDESRDTLRTPARIMAFVISIRKEGRTREEALRKIKAIRASLLADLEQAEDWEAKTRIFADYARLYSEHHASDMGGYWVVYDVGQSTERFAELEKAARGLPLQTLSEVHEMPDSFIVMMVESIQDPELPSLEAAREKIRRLLMSRRNETAERRMFEGLKERYRVKVFPENLLGCGAGVP